MKLKHVLIAAVVFLLICAAAYISVAGDDINFRDRLHLNYWRAQLAETPSQIYDRSAGGFDEAAALALARAEATPRQTPATHHLAARIIERNALAQEQAPAERRALRRRARNHHRGALYEMTPQRIALEEINNAAHRGFIVAAGGADLDADGPGLGFILDAVLEAVYDAGPAGAGMFGGNGEAAAVFFDADLIDLVEDRKEMSVAARKEAAAEIADGGGGGRGARAEAYLDLSQRNTNDRQNSHDVSVNASKRAIVARLRETQVGALPSLDSIIKEIEHNSDNFSRDPRTGSPRPALTEKAVKVVLKASHGERSMSAGATDAEVLRLVWLRAEDPRNAAVADQMKQAAFDALVDSWEPGLAGESIQCPDGRISRMLGSLSTLDHDETTWSMRRLEQYKNDIFDLAKTKIRQYAADALDSPDPELAKVGQSYLATTPAELAAVGEVSEAAEQEWVEETRKKVGADIDRLVDETNKRIPGAIPPYSVEGIKIEALAALG